MKQLSAAILLAFAAGSVFAQAANDTAVDTQAGANNNLNFEGNGPQRSLSIGFGMPAQAPALPMATPCVTSGSSGLSIAWGAFSNAGSDQKIRDFCEFKDRYEMLIKTCRFKSAATLMRDFYAKSDLVIEVHPDEKDLTMAECTKPIIMEPPAAGPKAPPPAPAPVPAPAPAPAPVPTPAPAPQHIILQGDALFDYDKADLKPGALGMLDRISNDLMKANVLTMTVIGHTDSDGSDAYNLKLSNKRANAVRDYLIGKGVAPEKIIAAGRGESEPVVPNTSDVNKAKNRRVDLQVHTIK